MPSRLRDLYRAEAIIPIDFVPSFLTPILEKHVISLPSRTLNCSLADFIEMHHDPSGNRDDLDEELLITFCACCDGLDSGIDKSSPHQCQNEGQFYIASAFGYEQPQSDNEKGSLVGPCELTEIREEFCNILISQLDQINDNMAKIVKTRRSILDADENAFINVLGETRRAANWIHSCFAN